MSDTYKTKFKGKLKAEDKKLDSLRKQLTNKLIKKGYGNREAITLAYSHVKCAWDRLTKEEKYSIVNYSKAPSWWTRMFSNIPKRRKDKNTCKKITLENCDEFLFTEARKPFSYYW